MRAPRPPGERKSRPPNVAGDRLLFERRAGDSTAEARPYYFKRTIFFMLVTDAPSAPFSLEDASWTVSL